MFLPTQYSLYVRKWGEAKRLPTLKFLLGLLVKLLADECFVECELTVISIVIQVCYLK